MNEVVQIQFADKMLSFDTFLSAIRNVVADSQMPQSTYDEIVDTLTTRNGFQPTEHQIVTYYYERFQK